MTVLGRHRDQSLTASWLLRDVVEAKCAVHDAPTEICK